MIKVKLLTEEGWIDTTIKLSEESKKELEDLKKKLGLEEVQYLNIRC